MKKVAILVADLFDDNELFYPYYRFLEAGATVHLIGAIQGKTHTSKKGQTATADIAAKDVDASAYDLLMIPGGFSPDYMRRSPDIVAFAKAMNDLNKPIGAICHGAWLMISACDLKNRSMTCYHSIKDDIINAGAIYVDQEVVVDGNFVTSRTPQDLPVFMKTLLTKL